MATEHHWLALPAFTTYKAAKVNSQQSASTHSAAVILHLALAIKTCLKQPPAALHSCRAHVQTQAHNLAPAPSDLRPLQGACAQACAYSLVAERVRSGCLMAVLSRFHCRPLGSTVLVACSTGTLSGSCKQVCLGLCQSSSSSSSLAWHLGNASSAYSTGLAVVQHADSIKACLDDGRDGQEHVVRVDQAHCTAAWLSCKSGRRQRQASAHPPVMPVKPAKAPCTALWPRMVHRMWS